MDTRLFKSVIDADNAAVCICDLNHIVVYMNKAAVNKYHVDITGKSIFDCHNPKSKETIIKVVDYFKADVSHNSVHTFYNAKENRDIYMIALRDDEDNLIGYYEKHCYRDIDNTGFYEGIDYGNKD